MYRSLDAATKNLLREGAVIPAHPLALNPDRKLDEYRQRRLTRYYMASGAGGVAVGVHTTQFDIRRPEIGLLEQVLRLAAEEIQLAWLDRPFLKIAGICGPLEQALREAALAVRYGYHLGLLSMGGLSPLSETELLERTRAVAAIIPIFGFYLQPAVGGRILSYGFWRSFAEIPNVYAIKIAAFDRYQTLDVVRAVCASGRREEIALYTGNDDNIVADLLTPYRFVPGEEKIEKRFAGGLLGHWAVWTREAVSLLKEVKECIANDYSGAAALLAKGMAITDMNAVIFDASHAFKGCIPGIHEILRRQGLLEGRFCLDPHEGLSEGQMQEIDRICKAYPSLQDDEFVKNFEKRDKNG
jgi:hypothetical protein